MNQDKNIIPQQSGLPSGQSSKQPDKQRSTQPATIEELRQWYADRHLPPEQVTRFFIGKDIREPKAFGIYKDGNGNFVVYKNKANGERAVRYQGRDEAFAVGELLNRLKEEILRRKSKNSGSPTGNGSGPAYLQHGYGGSSQRSAVSTSTSSGNAFDNHRDGCLIGADNLRDGCSGRKNRKGCFVGGIIAAILALFVGIFGKGVPNGYYHYQDNYYYHLGSSWFIYNMLTNEWAPTTSLDEWITDENAEQYRTNSFDGSRFENTGWYEEYYSSNDNDSDSDYDYDWDDDDDSWDSDDTDWDDDW